MEGEGGEGKRKKKKKGNELGDWRVGRVLGKGFTSQVFVFYFCFLVFWFFGFLVFWFFGFFFVFFCFFFSLRG